MPLQKPNRKSKYKQGYYKLHNPEKYLGKTSSIVFSYKFMGIHVYENV